eukprot:14043603-Ditylum_brightwellii.AAC.1
MGCIESALLFCATIKTVVDLPNNTWHLNLAITTMFTLPCLPPNILNTALTLQNTLEHIADTLPDKDDNLAQGLPSLATIINLLTMCSSLFPVDMHNLL